MVKTNVLTFNRRGVISRSRVIIRHTKSHKLVLVLLCAALLLSLRNVLLVLNYKLDESIVLVNNVKDMFLTSPAPIPKIIWQTAKSHDEPPPASKKIMDTWNETTNPSWTRKLLDDEELVTFMATYYNQTVVDAFKELPLPVMKADFFRMAVMYHKGGVYADVDVECKKPIESWSNGAIDRCEVVLGMENDHHICNWGFASRRHHPLFKKAVDLSLSRFVNTKIDTTHEHFVHYVTGPELFTHALQLLINDDGCKPIPPPKNPKQATPKYAKVLYNECRDTLKEKHGICLFDVKTQKGWFENHYSSLKKSLQSEDWVTSWTEQRKELTNQ